MSPDLRLRLHATQAQPCFPAASNALALPGGNGIFTATPTERITHYTLLRKVVCQMGALPPLETPTRKGGTLPLHGAHTAFSCYPALRLYRLSKSPRGIDVVSLTLGNSMLTFLHSQNWTGKTVIPFMTHGGWPGHVIADIKTICAGAKFAPDMEIQFDSQGGADMLTDQAEIDAWIDSVKKYLQ